MKRELPFHLLTILTMLIWGGSAACTKVMLQGFTAIHILFLKYCVGYLALVILCPKPVRSRNKHDELLFFLCGFSGMTLCFLFENLALVFTSSATVSVMMNLSPILVMVFQMLIRAKHSGVQFWFGCALSMFGAWLVAFNGLVFQQANVGGITLAVLAAVAWAAYSLLSEKLGDGYELKASMRRIFFYGVVTQIPLVLWENQKPDLAFAFTPQSMLLILYMGVLVGAMGYIFWNTSIIHLGSVKTNMYIYLLPLFTMAISALTIHEAMGLYQWGGAVMTIVGVALAQQDKHLTKQP